VAATAECDGRLIRGEGKGLALVIDERKFSLDEQRTIGTAADVGGHGDMTEIG
jgi:hypothetical protein